MRSTMLRDFYHLHKINRMRKLWRNENTHNDTWPVNVFDSELVTVGKGAYGEIKIVTFSNKTKLRIGNYVSIAQSVTFLLDVEHYLNHISTYPFKVKMLKSEDSEAYGKGDIIIDDDVWIGYGATILSGVHIGQGAVIAAGAVVSADVPPYAIVGGVPAKLIKYRFSNEMIKSLLEIDYSKLTKEMIVEHELELYEELKVSEQLEWMPKK